MFVLGLPLAAGADVITLLAFVGGLSAATAMVIVDSVALAIMVCNGLVVPLLLRGHFHDARGQEDMAWLLLAIRRVAIFVIVLLGYLFYLLLGQTHGLASIGLVSFAAIAQFAPAFFGGLLWRNATARGAIAGIVTGFRRLGLHAAAAMDHRGRLAAPLHHDGRPVRPGLPVARTPCSTCASSR